MTKKTEENQNLRHWTRFCQPPPKALKKIKAGRLKGMSDINPQWRLLALTEMFGPVGEGWYTEIADTKVEHGADGVIVASVHVNLFYKDGEQWSKPVVGIGGSMLVAKESAGLRTSDEAFKMAETDAISVCCKKLGIAADVYLGQMDTKYAREQDEPNPQTSGNFSDDQMSIDQQNQLVNSIIKSLDAGKLTVKGIEQLYKDNAKDINRLKPGTQADLIAYFGEKKAEAGSK